MFVFITPPGQLSIPDTRGFLQDANRGTIVHSPLAPLFCSGRCCGSFRGLFTNSSLFKEFKEGYICVCVVVAFEINLGVFVICSRISARSSSITKRCQSGGRLLMVLSVFVSATAISRETAHRYI